MAIWMNFLGDRNDHWPKMSGSEFSEEAVERSKSSKFLLTGLFASPAFTDAMSGTIAEVWWAHLLDTYGERTIATLGTE